MGTDSPAPELRQHLAEAAELDRLRALLAARDREVRELRDQLRAIQNSDAWAILRTLEQSLLALAPHGTRRDRLARRLMRGLRRIKKLAILLAHAPEAAAASLRAALRGGPRIEPATRRHYAIICLPMIEWRFRFQRPQQLMREFARASHLVLYAANRFHGGSEARARPIDTNVLEMVLPGDPATNIYQHAMAPVDRERMRVAIQRLANARGIKGAVVVAQHPYWTPLAEALRENLGWPIVYDCMDDHSGFLHNGRDVLRAERQLVATADLVVASSAELHEAARLLARSAILVRNACEYTHFDRPAPPRAASDRPTIGYYGAIAEWFDSSIVAALAALRPGWRFELIGSTLGGDVRPLCDLENVRLLGECPYADLPSRIASWDAYIIPFRRVPLTEATNPVKMYEMLATGKPVVAVGLPELLPIAEEGLVQLAATAGEFAAAIEQALREDDEAIRDRRKAFARANTWRARHRALADAIEAIRATRHGSELARET